MITTKIIAALLISVFLFASATTLRAEPQYEAREVDVFVTKVLSGDTFWVRFPDGTSKKLKLRISKYGQINKKDPTAAKKKLKKMIEGEEVSVVIWVHKKTGKLYKADGITSSGNLLHY